MKGITDMFSDKSSCNVVSQYIVWFVLAVTSVLYVHVCRTFAIHMLATYSYFFIHTERKDLCPMLYSRKSALKAFIIIYLRELKTG